MYIQFVYKLMSWLYISYIIAPNRILSTRASKGPALISFLNICFVRFTAIPVNGAKILEYTKRKGIKISKYNKIQHKTHPNA